MRTLTVDIGGSGIKAFVLNKKGEPVTKRSRLKTPRPAKPDAVIEAILQLSAGQGDFDRVSIGFPGVVNHGITKTAHNLHPSWIGFHLSKEIRKALGRPTRVANDADIQGYGAVTGEGLELVLTLGTGLGSALFLDGMLVPNLELAHHPYNRSNTYEEYLGRRALDRVGKKRWTTRVLRAADRLERLFNYDNLLLGGGNAKKLRTKLPENIRIVENLAGLLGGIALWKCDHPHFD